MARRPDAGSEQKTTCSCSRIPACPGPCRAALRAKMPTRLAPVAEILAAFVAPPWRAPLDDPSPAAVHACGRACRQVGTPPVVRWQDRPVPASTGSPAAYLRVFEPLVAFPAEQRELFSRLR